MTATLGIWLEPNLAGAAAARLLYCWSQRSWHEILTKLRSPTGDVGQTSSLLTGRAVSSTFVDGMFSDSRVASRFRVAVGCPDYSIVAEHLRDVERMDTLTAEARSERMSRVRSRNTKPELAVRRLLHGMGYRYRVHGTHLPGSPDLVFTKRRKVILIHGCFWHRHPGCKNTRLPKSKLAFWTRKFEENQRRDAENLQRLSEAGWSTLVLWECEVKRLSDHVERITTFLGPAR
jgi:DNA mismatch endonuclease (patch repair protein)